MKAIETKEKDDDTKWLTYWVVFAVFTIVEYFSDFIVGWFPVYWLVKVCYPLFYSVKLRRTLILRNKIFIILTIFSLKFLVSVLHLAHDPNGVQWFSYSVPTCDSPQIPSVSTKCR